MIKKKGNCPSSKIKEVRRNVSKGKEQRQIYYETEDIQSVILVDSTPFHSFCMVTERQYRLLNKKCTSHRIPALLYKKVQMYRNLLVPLRRYITALPSEGVWGKTIC